MAIGALLLVAGCRTPPGADATAKAAPAGRPATRDLGASLEEEEEALQRRADAYAHYALAVIHEWNEQWEAVAEEYYQAARANPEDERLVLEAATRLLQLKQIDKAVEILADAAKRPEASGRLYAQLGRAYEIQGKDKKALRAYQQAVKRSPDELLGYRFLAEAYLKRGDHQEGLKLIDKGLNQKTTNAIFYIGLSEICLAYGRATSMADVRPRALKALERAASLNPTNLLAVAALADAFAAWGQTKRATELYQQLLDRGVRLPGLREKLTDLYLRQEDHKRAAEQLDALIRENPTNARAYFLRGSLALDDKDYNKAIECFRKATLLKPDFAEAYYSLSMAQIANQQAREALITLEKARARFEQNFVLEFYTAMAYGQLKDYTNSLQHLTAAEVIARATETNRLNHILYFQLGAACERLKKYEESERYFRKCLEMKPDFAEALNYLGYMWAERGVNLDEAREMIEEAVKLEPDNAAFIDSLGWVLFKQGHVKEALTHILKAVELSDEPDPTLYDHLGDIYWELDQPDKAVTAWRKSLELEENETIRAKLDKAYREHPELKPSKPVKDTSRPSSESGSSSPVGSTDPSKKPAPSPASSGSKEAPASDLP